MKSLELKYIIEESYRGEESSQLDLYRIASLTCALASLSLNSAPRYNKTLILRNRTLRQLSNLNGPDPLTNFKSQFLFDRLKASSSCLIVERCSSVS